MGEARTETTGAAPTLASLGLVDRTARGAHAALLSAGWPEIGYGYHGSVHAHPDHPDVVVRLAREVDGFGDYAGLLRRGLADVSGPHAPWIVDMHVSRCHALMTVSRRLREAPADAWWLAYAHAVIADHGDEGPADVAERFRARWPGREPRVDAACWDDGVRERFRAAWPGYEPFVAALRALAPRRLDPNDGNVMMDAEGNPVVNDPLCDGALGLWLPPARRALWRLRRGVGRVRAAIRASARPAAAAVA